MVLLYITSGMKHENSNSLDFNIIPPPPEIQY